MSEAPTTTYTAEWSVDNPDSDALRYRLSYRREGRATWLSILREIEILTRPKYEWNTEGVPDGFYRLRVEATDELDTPAADVLRTVLESEPFLIDNHAPHLDGLVWADGVLRGIAIDDQGPITTLDHAVDGGDWLPFHPEDALFDTAREKFSVPLALAKGVHIVAVRATDARRNSTVAELEVNVK